MKFLTYIRVYLITFDPISFTLDSRLNILNRNIRLCSAVSDEFNVSLNSHRRGVAGFSFFFLYKRQCRGQCNSSEEKSILSVPDKSFLVKLSSFKSSKYFANSIK